MINLISTKIVQMIKLSSKQKNKSKDEGIITLADEHYFQGLLILYHSVQASYPVPIICYDIGLTNEQKSWCKNNLHNLFISPIPEHQAITKIKNYKEKSKLAKKGKRQWPLWICPFLIQDSPFEKTLWLDCDLIILRNLESLFKKINSKPVFTPENLAPQVTANKPELYELLPIKHNYHEQSALINAGVSGWHKKRDEAILSDYSYVVEQAFENEKIKNAISWHDQGALIWAILNNKMENNIETDWKWNTCVKHTAAKEIKFTWSMEALKEIQKKVPESNILHWNGQTVPWN